MTGCGGFLPSNQPNGMVAVSSNASHAMAGTRSVAAGALRQPPPAPSEHNLELRSQVGRLRAAAWGNSPDTRAESAGVEAQTPSRRSFAEKAPGSVLGLGRWSSRDVSHRAADSRGLIVIPTVMQLAQRRYGRMSCRPLLGANPTGITHVVFSTTPTRAKKFIRSRARVCQHQSPPRLWFTPVYMHVHGSALMMIFPLNIRSVLADSRRVATWLR